MTKLLLNFLNNLKLCCEVFKLIFQLLFHSLFSVKPEICRLRVARWKLRRWKINRIVRCGLVIKRVQNFNEHEKKKMKSSSVMILTPSNNIEHFQTRFWSPNKVMKRTELLQKHQCWIFIGEMFSTFPRAFHFVSRSILVKICLQHGAITFLLKKD